jgi:hypothetical protein
MQVGAAEKGGSLSALALAISVLELDVILWKSSTCPCLASRSPSRVFAFPTGLVARDGWQFFDNSGAFSLRISAPVPALRNHGSQVGKNDRELTHSLRSSLVVPSTVRTLQHVYKSQLLPSPQPSSFMAPASYDLYFTGSRGNPRQCIVIGEDVEPVFFRFETPDVYMTNTRTTVSVNLHTCAFLRPFLLLPSPKSYPLPCPASYQIYRNQGEEVAAFDWTASIYLGLVTILNRPAFPMSQLVLQGTTPK